MNRIAFIIPYFGKFNNYFQLYLNSCEKNADFCDWLIFTDDHTEYRYPLNVKVHYTTFDETKELFQSKFDFKIALDRPYKLCDFKVAYGYIYSDYLKDYDFWGECDTDLIWGRFSDFHFDKLSKYDKIFNLAHCTIYRNTNDVSTAFMLPLQGRLRYKEVFSNTENCSFDEEYHKSINNIFLENGLSVYENCYAANTYTKTSDFKLTRLSKDTHQYKVEKKSRNFFVWDNGVLTRYRLKGDEIKTKEYLYIHFQSRPMQKKVADDCMRYKIIPNAFEPLEVEEINEDTIKKVKMKNFNLHYFRLRSKNLMIKIKKRVKR